MLSIDSAELSSGRQQLQTICHTASSGPCPFVQLQPDCGTDACLELASCGINETNGNLLHLVSWHDLVLKEAPLRICFRAGAGLRSENFRFRTPHHQSRGLLGLHVDLNDGCCWSIQ